MDAELVTGVSARTLPLPLRLLGDERLARLVGSGHEEAFTILYQRHHQALYRYCRSLVGTDADAQDALQSAMTGALVALRVSRRDAPIRPWLFRIVHNESMSQLRRRRPTDELADELPALDASPHGAVEQRARLSRLVADLRDLPERQRGALVMRELSGLSHQDVAQALGVSVGAAKQMVFEARRSLQEFDEGRSMACDDVRRLISDGDGRSLRGRRVRAHLRDCGGCSAFAAAIPQRRADLNAMAPILPAGAAAGLLFRITGAGSGQTGGGGVGMLGGAAGKAAIAGASSKLLATGALIVATAAVGTTGVIRAISGPAPASPSGSALTRADPAGLAGPLGSSRHRPPAGHRAAAAQARAHLHGAGTAAAVGKLQSHHHAGAANASRRHAASTARARGHSHGQGTRGGGSVNSARGTGGRHLGTQKSSGHGQSSGAQAVHPAQPIKSSSPASTVTSVAKGSAGPSAGKQTGGKSSPAKSTGGAAVSVGGGGAGGGSSANGTGAGSIKP